MEIKRKEEIKEREQVKNEEMTKMTLMEKKRKFFEKQNNEEKLTKEKERMVLKKSLIKSEKELLNINEKLLEFQTNQNLKRTEEELQKKVDIEEMGNKEKERLELLHDLEKERGTRREEKSKRVEVTTELNVLRNTFETLTRHAMDVEESLAEKEKELKKIQRDLEDEEVRNFLAYFAYFAR